ncbi:hypothetical protein GCM10023238_12510 [Streptomyces heliomycini]
MVVDGEWGTVEEITLTFLTVRTWDERRITMPVSVLHLQAVRELVARYAADDRHRLLAPSTHSAPLEAMRDKLRDVLRECPAWDGRAFNLTVTDSTPSTMEVRAW